MSLNRSLLSQITADLEKKKKPSVPKVPRNQWQHPGEITKVDSPNITMDGVSYPVLGVPNVGPAQMMQPDEQYNYPGASNVTEYPLMRSGGYTVTRSHDRKGKTHKVTGPDGTVKYFGDSKLGQHPSDPARKKAFYARHKHNLDHNPYFRAFARATWQDGGEIDQMQTGGLWDKDRAAWVDSVNHANMDKNFVQRMYDTKGLQMYLPGSKKPSTHFMESGDSKAYPTVVQRPGNKFLEWLNQTNPDAAAEYAYRTGEYIQFPNDEQATWYGQNGYKKGKGVVIGKKRGGSTYSGGVWFQDGGNATDMQSSLERMGPLVTNPSMNTLESVASYIPGLETAVDLKDMIAGAVTGDYAQMQRGKLGIVLPVSGKAIMSTMDLASPGSAAAINEVVNMSKADHAKLFKKYGYGGYDQWVKAGRPKLEQGGDMIKRADGSYSKRGLWDNIRANKGSGKKPTPEMLEQERKIKAEMQKGGQIMMVDSEHDLQQYLNRYQTGGTYVDLKKEYNLDPLSKIGIEKAKELAATNPNLRFVCTASGCAQIAADAAEAYDQNYYRSNAWDLANKNQIGVQNPRYAALLNNGVTAPLPDPTGYNVPQNIMQASNQIIGLNRRNNLKDEKDAALAVGAKNIKKGASKDAKTANDSFDYANPYLYPNTRGYEHVGFNLGDNLLLHGTGEAKDHPGFYSIDNMKDGIQLPGYGKYEPVESIQPAGMWQTVMQKVGIKKKGGSTYSGNAWFQIGGNPFAPVVTQEDTSLEALYGQIPGNEQQEQQPAAAGVFGQQLQNRVAKDNPALQMPSPFTQKLGAVQNKLAQGMMGDPLIGAVGNIIEGINNQKDYNDKLDKQRQNYSTDYAYNTNYTNQSSKGQYDMYGTMMPNQIGGNLSFTGMNQKYSVSPTHFQAGGDYSRDRAEVSFIPDELIAYRSPFINLEQPDIRPSFDNAAPNESPISSNASSSSLSAQIAARESGGNYEAYNPKGGGEGAVGKYQFRWNIHKDWIRPLTGVNTKEEFMKNPEAQEKAFRQWDKSTLTPSAIQLKQSLGLSASLDEIKRQIHFAGVQGARDYYAKGKLTRDANGTTNATYQEGGEVEMTEAELNRFLRMGGQVEFC